MRPSKEHALTYFSDVRSHYAIYHNHKETSAWGAVALYLIAVIQVVGTIGFVVANTELLGRGAVIGLLGLAIVKYVSIQFKLRETSANVIAACFDLHAAYLSTDEASIDENLFKLADSPNAKHQTPFILPRIILDKMEHYKNRGHEMRQGLESAIYFSIGLIASAGLIMIYSHWNN